ncbi:hypothetical protein QYM36_001068 [Artemia franciscana]|uniref:CUB domain-containing protein n=1 Tax=Artemia franciscana TaxID=6661 RepID=A0AA88I9J3_ARTSF|nr:hypothetical protein QYM36_001068 [Artemia franciscana]
MNFLSVFSIIRFPNNECVSTNPLYNGTCLSSAECSTGGGTAYGTCASGFGVCCVFVVSTCGSTSNKNCTYFQNPEYPTGVNPQLQCSLTVQKCNPNICQLRLDFQDFVIAQPNTAEYSEDAANYQGQCDTDSFTISGGSNPIPILCGNNTGQHMYVDMSSGQNAFTMTFSIGNGPGEENGARTWNVKITQLPCSSITNAPAQCLQYYTSTTGTLTSFNYGDGLTHLANQDYAICIRMAEGYCGICYTACSDSAIGISDGSDPKVGAASCNLDWLNIAGGFAQGTTKSADRFCGMGLVAADGDNPSPICTTSKPFEVRFRTNQNEAEDDADTGFCVNYNQQPCNR